MENTTINSRMGKQQRQEDKKKKRKIFIWLILAAAIAILVILLAVRPAGAPARVVSGDLLPGTGTAQEGHLPDMTDEQVRKQMQKTADESQFSFKINAQPVFEDGAGEGTLRIENPGHNTYPFAVEIYLAGSNEKIYESGAVMPDQHIAKGKLEKVLPQGTHEAVAYINAYDPDTNEYQGRSAVNLSIVIKN